MSTTQNQDSNTKDENNAQGTNEPTNVISNSNIQGPTIKNRIKENTRRNNNRQPRTGSRPFVTHNVDNIAQRGVIEDILVLRSSAERGRKDQFVIFQEDLENYIKKNFDKPKDILCLVKDGKDPEMELQKEIPRADTTKTKIEKMKDISEEEKELILTSVNDLHTQKIKLFAGQ